MKRWYVVHTKQNGERTAEANLVRQGFRSYCPQISAIPAKVQRVPLFPRYMFVELDLDADPWRSVNGTIGVVGLVQFGPKPSPVPPGVVEDIMRREGEDGLIVLPHPYPRLQAGDEIVLSNGPLDRQLGIIHRLTGPRRAEILLQLMGREVKVTAPLSQVSAA